ncbi:MAG: hypothetical protein JXR29_05175 [Methylothermaceae bacterium]|nr:hypothetical protein [Methylothermaceae bacterium]
MNARIVDLIRSFDGKAYEATGQILAWFDDPDQARVCADRIACGWRLPVDVSGTSLAVAVKTLDTGISLVDAGGGR